MSREELIRRLVEAIEKSEPGFREVAKSFSEWRYHPKAELRRAMRDILKPPDSAYKNLDDFLYHLDQEVAAAKIAIEKIDVAVQKYKEIK